MTQFDRKPRPGRSSGPSRSSDGTRSSRSGSGPRSQRSDKTAGAPRGAGAGRPRSGKVRIPPPPTERSAPNDPMMIIDEGPVSPPRGRTGAGSSKRQRGPKPEIDLTELVRAVGASRAKILQVRVEQAAVAFAQDHFVQARKILRPIVEEAPSASGPREILGLVQYRLGNWDDAIRHLEMFCDLNPGCTEQHPVLEDCYRAKRRWARVEELWNELRESSPSGDLVNEGRIVYAGSLADQGRLVDAIRELERGWRVPSRPKTRHIRRAYALAKMYDRSGDQIRATRLYQWLEVHDPDFDAEDPR